MSSAEPTSQGRDKAARKAARAERRGLWRRHGLPSLLFSLLLTTVLGLTLYLLMGRPIHAPDWLRERIETQVASSADQASLSFDTLELVLEEQRYPRVRMTNVRVLSPSGAEVVGFAEMRAGLSMRALLSGRTLLTSVDVSGVFANLRRERDGSVVLSGGYEIGAPAQQAASFGALIGRIDTLLAQPAMAALQSAGIQALTLRLEDARSGKAWTIDGGRVQASRSGDTLRLTSDLAVLSGGQGVATLEANYQSDVGSLAAEFGLNITDVAASDIAAIASPLAWLDVLRAPISGAMRGGIDSAGKPTELSATLTIAGGVLQPNDATRPIPFTSAQSYFAYDPANGVMRFDALSVKSDWITVDMDGQALLNITQDAGLEDLVGQFRASVLTANPADLYDAPIAMDAAATDFRMRFNPFRLEVGEAIFEDGGQRVLARGHLNADADGWRYGLDAQMDGVAPDRLMELWPVVLAPKARGWIDRNLLAGQLKNIDFVLRDGPDATANMYLSFDYDAADIRYVNTLPILRGAGGTASLLDGRFVVQIDEGQVDAPTGGSLDVAGSAFIIPDVRVKGGAPAVVRLIANGPVEAALALLDEPPLSVMSKAGLATDVASGQLAASGTLSLPLRDGVSFADMEFDATGTASAVTSETMIEGRVLKADTLRIAASETQVAISGPGTLDGVAFDAEWTQTIGQSAEPGSVSGVLELSQTAVNAFDIGLPPGTVSGSGWATFNVDLPRAGAPPRLTLESDLKGVGLASSALGWRKPASTSGALSVALTLGATPKVDRIALRAAGLEASGSVTLTAAGGLRRARFDRVRMGGWLDAPVDLIGQGAGAPPAVNVRGGTLDLRAADFGGANSGGGGGAQSSGPLSIALDRLQITDTIAITGMRGAFNLAGGLDGTFSGLVNGAASIEGQVLPQNGRSAVRIRSSDAGRVAAAAGLLKQARGGDLLLTLLPVGAASFDGTLDVKNTRIQDAPAIAALLNALSIVGLLEQMGGSGIHFGQVEAAFRMSPSAITITRASAVGASMGLSMDGTYDVNSKALDMQGVISPIYALNAIGSIFTRKGEGLIGFNYRLRGSADRPQVTVNPLSALTPGMFRNIFRRPPPEVPDGGATKPQAFATEDAAAGESTAEQRRRRLQEERDAR